MLPGNQEMLLNKVKNTSFSRTQILLSKQMFPGSATLEETTFPSL